MDAMKDRLLLRFAIRETIGTIIVGVALFWSAGTLAWWPAWAVVAVTFVWTIATGVVIMRTNPDLLAERLGPRKGGKPWDTAIMGVVALTTLVRLVVAGLDHRHGWTGDFPQALQIAALAIGVIGYALVVWATGSNAYFSQIVRIQTEREHAVASGGPYRFVRHPGYVGSILYELSLPLLLASWWAFLLGLLNAGLFVVRTALEDRDLQNELDGYKAYTERVRFRLLPGVW
jgi:protein-S-isoprenylcysteine O-methyltransferase Ste14